MSWGGRRDLNRHHDLRGGRGEGVRFCRFCREELWEEIDMEMFGLTVSSTDVAAVSSVFLII